VSGRSWSTERTPRASARASGGAGRHAEDRLEQPLDHEDRRELGDGREARHGERDRDRPAVRPGEAQQLPEGLGIVGPGAPEQVAQRVLAATLLETPALEGVDVLEDHMGRRHTRRSGRAGIAAR
jgi:hypothetical protein